MLLGLDIASAGDRHAEEQHEERQDLDPLPGDDAQVPDGRPGECEAQRVETCHEEVGITCCQAHRGSDVATPEEMPYARHVYHVYAVRTSQRDALQQALRAQGIHTGIHYPIPLHLQEAHADLGYRSGDFPCSEQAASEVLSLPMFAELSSAQQERVAVAVRQS